MVHALLQGGGEVRPSWYRPGRLSCWGPVGWDVGGLLKCAATQMFVHVASVTRTVHHRGLYSVHCAGGAIGDFTITLNCETQLWNRIVKHDCETQLWKRIVKHDCDTRLWNRIVTQGYTVCERLDGKILTVGSSSPYPRAKNNSMYKHLFHLYLACKHSMWDVISSKKKETFFVVS